MLRAAVAETLEPRRLMAADLVISEFLASNDTSIVDAFSNHEDWIEIHNRGDAAANLNDYFLTDSTGNPEKWRFPVQTLAAGANLVVFASNRNLAVAGSELHTNFQLAGEGEYLALIRAADDSVQFEFAPTYPAQSADISYGLTDSNNAASARIYFSVPTPGANNAPSVASVAFSVPGKTFSTSQVVSLSTTTPGATIYYTTNNTAPTTASTVYTSAITLTASKIVRAIATAPGLVNSPISSQSYTAVGSTTNFRSNLPIVVLDSFNQSFTDAAFVNGSATFIDKEADGYADVLDPVNFSGRVGLRYRGSTSFSNYPKDSFAIEVRDEINGDRNASILGMPADSDWILYAPWTERSLMNNALAMDWSRQMGHYASRIRFVEVYLNNDTDGSVTAADDYLGIYMLMEKPKIDDNRVDINEVLPTATAEPDITGGYFFKKDRQEASEIEIQVPGGAETAWQPFVFVEPAAPTAPQVSYLTNYLNELDSVMQGAGFADPVNGYAKYIDVDSWIDFWIMSEFTKSADAFWLSTFYHKAQGGKIEMGPVWDFNLAFGQFNYRNGASASGWGNESLGVWGAYGSTGFGDQYGYFGRLFDDPTFKTKVADRWQELRKTVFASSKMMSEVDAYVALLTDNNGDYPVGPGAPTQTSTNAAIRNFKKWPVLGVYSTPNSFFDQQGQWIDDVKMMKDWIKARAEWMDTQFVPAPVLSPAGGDFNSPTNVTITPKQHGTPVDTVLLASGAPARAFVPTANIANWQTAGFSVPGTWMTGTTPIGYDLSPAPVNYGTMGLDVSSMRNVRNSVFTRVTFNVANPASVTGSLILRMKYDDGFVVWLNGVRVMERMVKENYNFGPTGTTLNPIQTNAYNEFAGLAPPGGSYASVARDETQAIQFAEFDISDAKSALVAGTNVLAIQGLNDVVGSDDLLILPEIVSRTYSTVNTGNVYYTTDGSDPRNPDGTVNQPAATLYGAALNLSTSTRIRARRMEVIGGINVWSGITDENYSFDANTLRVTEIMYNAAAGPVGSPYTAQDFEYVEVKNTGASPLNLNGMHFTSGITFAFANEQLAAGEYGVIVKNLAAFESRYGTSRRVLGVYTGNLDNSGEAIAFANGLDEVRQTFTYDDIWYPETDGPGQSLVILDPAGAMTNWDLAAGWRASYGLRGAPGASDESDSTAPTFASADFDPSLDRVRFFFSEPVSYAAASGLTITDLVTNTTVSPTSAGASGSVATFVLPAALADGVYRVNLPTGGVMDMSINPLAAAAQFTFIYVATGNTLALPLASPTYVVNQLAIENGATLDVRDNDLILRGVNLSTATTLIYSGFGNSNWLGSGITSSVAAAAPVRALGVIQASDVSMTLFNTITVNGSDVIVKHTWSGDANLDGVVNFDDFNKFLAGYANAAANPARWLTGDFNFDGFVNFDDFNKFLSGFNAYNASGLVL